jgi:hypothetical protein
MLKFRMETEDPERTNDLIETALPRARKSKTDTDMPSSAVFASKPGKLRPPR